MWWIAIVGVLVIAGASAGSIASDVEQPKYTISASDQNIEIRDYSPMIIAQVEVSGERDQAISQGFRLIADYIFGNNMGAEKLGMTAPVILQANMQQANMQQTNMQQTSVQRTNIEQRGEKIAMTAPVIQQGDGNAWQVRFIMPRAYTMASIPKPKDPSIKLKEVEGKRFAVVRFSGLVGKNLLEGQTDRLEIFIRTRKLTPINGPIYAFYNPPWTLPFLRRNEVMIELAN